MRGIGGKDTKAASDSRIFQGKDEFFSAIDHEFKRDTDPAWLN